ncbi:MAG: gamma-glutamyl-gamma-aminobutyrate hydrolase [Rickettsiales bacterium]|nr:gamma-glutamyl-gamma-aminobutyrate hydrolase [Rickettsiales bacterium]
MVVHAIVKGVRLMVDVTTPRPVIAITFPDEGYTMMRLFTRLAVWLAGGKPVLVHPSDPQFDMTADGLVLGGGQDVYPPLYHQRAKPDYVYNHARDKLETLWLKRMDDAGKPVLGICRGAQLMNIVRGGTLHRDFSKIYEEAEYPNSLIAKIFYRKAMYVQPTSTLAKVTGCNPCRVNSMHTQSIANTGKNLTVTAMERNGVVQCIEDTAKPLFMGVQFHPEFLIYNARYRELFGYFVNQAKQMMQATNSREYPTHATAH